MRETLKQPTYKTLLEMKDLAVRPVPGIILDAIVIEESRYQKLVQSNPDTFTTPFLSWLTDRLLGKQFANAHESLYAITYMSAIAKVKMHRHNRLDAVYKRDAYEAIEKLNELKQRSLPNQHGLLKFVQLTRIELGFIKGNLATVEDLDTVESYIDGYFRNPMNINRLKMNLANHKRL